MKLQERLRVLAKATPGPWRFVPWHIAEAPSQVHAPEGWLICETSSDADAELIALAPTMAAQLDLYEAALREARLQLLYVDERWPTGTTPAAVAKIDAALNSTDTGA